MEIVPVTERRTFVPLDMIVYLRPVIPAIRAVAGFGQASVTETAGNSSCDA